MTRLRKLFAAIAAAALIGVGAVGISSGADTTTTTTTAAATTTQQPAAEAPMGGGGGGTSASSASTEDELVALIQEAYGEPSLGLHRGHQDVESTLIEVLGVSHDEMHVRMEQQGQNLAAIAKDVGVDVQTLIDALVETRSSAIDSLVEAGTITQEEGDEYLQMLGDAYTFRVNWDGADATPAVEAV